MRPRESVGDRQSALGPERKEEPKRENESRKKEGMERERKEGLCVLHRSTDPFNQLSFPKRRGASLVRLFHAAEKAGESWGTEWNGDWKENGLAVPC